MTLLLHNNTPTIRKYYNPHILYVSTGIAFPWQLSQSIKQAIKDASIRLQREIETRFKINIIIDHSGKNYGYGYIWFTNPEVCYMLCGKNPDGSERCEYIDDTDWVPPSEPRPNRTLEEVLEHIKGKSWAEITDEEDEIERRYTCPKKKIELPPLMVLPPYDYTPEQLKLIQDSNETVGYFKVSPAYVKDVEDIYYPNILCGRNIPNWITEEDLKDIFIPYTTNSSFKIKRKINGIYFYDTYPFVTITKKIAFITFDTNTHDASFALLMCRKIEIEKNNQKCLIIFNHSYRSSQH